MTQVCALLRDGSVVLVCDDMDDGSVWAAAAVRGCSAVVMVPDGVGWLIPRLHPDGVWEVLRDV